MSIDFCSGNAFMAQHLLNRPQVGPTFDEVGSEGMPEGMRRNIFRNTCFLSQVFDDIKDHNPA